MKRFPCSYGNNKNGISYKVGWIFFETLTILSPFGLFCNYRAKTVTFETPLLLKYI